MKKYFVVLLLVFFSIRPAFAEEDKKGDSQSVTTMKEVVVTATRDEEQVRKVPASVTVITAEDINNSGATNIVDLLQNKANVHVREFHGNPSQAVIDLRGFGGDNSFGKTLVLLDGVRLNRPDMSTVNWHQIPLQIVDRIEVVRGTNTVLYGDAAIGGVINIITKKGALKPKADISILYGSDSNYVERAGVVGCSGKLSYALNGEHQGDKGWRKRSNFRSTGGGVRIGYDFSDNLAVSASGAYNKTDFEMPGNLTKADMAVSRTQYQPARMWFPPAWFGFPATSPAHTNDEGRTEYYNCNILIEGCFGKAGDIGINLAYGKKDIETDMPSFWPPPYNDLDIDTYGATPKYTLETDIFGFKNKSILGIDIYHETLALDQYLDQDRRMKDWKSDIKKDTLGWYIRNEFYPFREVILGLGYRYEKAKYEAKKERVLGTTFGTAFASQDKTHREDAYNIDLTWLVGELSKVYAKYSTLYRYPFFEEQVSFYGWADGFNLNLDPEKGKSYEVGFVCSLLENLDVGLTLYQTDMEDEIIWDNTLNRNINLDETKHRGIELSLSYEIKGLIRFNGNYAYHEAEFEKDQFKGKDVPFVPRHQISAGLDLTLPYDINLCPDMLYVSSSYLGNDFDNNSAKLDSYTVFNLLIRYQPKWTPSQPTAFFRIKNIFDKEYETMGFENDPNDGSAPANTFYPSGGREFLAGIVFQF